MKWDRVNWDLKVAGRSRRRRSLAYGEKFPAGAVAANQSEAELSEKKGKEGEEAIRKEQKKKNEKN